jgi:hypothetical protein
MTLREAFHYLRSRRHIIGPNFGFIKQVIFNLISIVFLYCFHLVNHI